LLHRLNVVPLVRTDSSLSVALSDPTDDSIIDEIERAARCPVHVSVATRGAIRGALTTILGPPPREAETEAVAGTPSKQFDVVWDRSGASFLLFYLSGALTAGASELQFWPRPGELRVVHRVGGRLVPVASEPPEVTYSLLSR